MVLGTSAFWQESGESMGIVKGRAETELSFCCRVMLSALSKWALTVAGGPAHTVSIARIQQVLEEKLADYLKLLPPNDPIRPDGITEAIYERLLQNGAFYHLPYSVRPAPHKFIKFGDVSLIRGLMPEEDARFSGLAPYVPRSTEEGNWADDFMLWPLSGSQTLDLVWKRSIRVQDSAAMEAYLNVERTGGGYYVSRKDPNWPFTLARKGQPGNPHSYDYYMLMGNEIRRIPDDYREASIQDYVRLAMMNKVSRQIITASITENIISVELGYMLPAPELRFVRYVSWPANIADHKNAFRFIFHPAVWSAIKERFTTLGYEVHEKT